MSIIRVRKDERYFTASNEPFVDTRLSWETRGLIAYLLTKPNNWQVRIDDLEKQGPAKLHKLRRMLAEARICGYMNRIRVTRADGTFDWITEVFESPSQNPKPSKNITSVRLSTSGSATSGKPADIVSTDLISTESTYIYSAPEKSEPAHKTDDAPAHPSVYAEIPVDEDFALVAKQLSALTGGVLNTSTAPMISDWLAVHPVAWVVKAIEKAKGAKGTSAPYVDRILQGWNAHGYPTAATKGGGKKKLDIDAILGLS
jgi:hypothetical protein